jgi:hypothetical protein
MTKQLEKEIEKFNTINDAWFAVCFKSQENKVNNELKRDAELLCQKYLLHFFSINTLAIVRSHFSSVSQNKKLNFLDPLSISSLLRAQFETYLAYNYIFVRPKSQEHKQISYLLWKIAGLKSRNHLRAKEKENKEKKRREKNTIDDYIDEIKKTHRFKNLIDLKEQKKFKDFIQKKDWKINIGNGKVTNYGWKDLALISGIKKSTFGEIYNMLSWYSHPTYLSIIQLRDMYDENNFNEQSVSTSLKLSSYLTSFIIYDYCSINKHGWAVLKSMPQEIQALIYLYNNSFRYKNTINNIKKNNHQEYSILKS